MNDYVGRFKDNTFLNETENLNKVLEELDLYKTKIDAFINYDYFNESTSANDSMDNSKGEIQKKEFYNMFEKYDKITEHLISQIKLKQNDVINNKFDDFNIKYEIVANPEMEMETLLNRMTELEDMLSSLERSVGNWEIVRNFLI